MAKPTRDLASVAHLVPIRGSEAGAGARSPEEGTPERHKLTAAKSGTPLFRYLEQTLKAQIASGELSPGSRLRSEEELAASYGMARMTARRAIEALVADGFLVRRRGVGTFVSDHRFEYRPASLFSFSRAMESQGVKVSTRLLGMYLCISDPDTHKSLGVGPQVQILCIKRLRLVNDEPVAINTSFVRPELYDTLDVEHLVSLPIGECIRRAGHGELASSQDYLEGRPATKEEAYLLETPDRAPVLIVFGTEFDTTGKALLVSNATYRADRFRFVLGATAREPVEVLMPGAREDAGRGV
jgi:GntR family transcriptional regulator